MLEMLLQWYRRRFTDPQAIALLVILLAGFLILYFLHGILTRCWWPSCWRICWNGQPRGCSASAVREIGRQAW
jgi:hypothetical protein